MQTAAIVAATYLAIGLLFAALQLLFDFAGRRPLDWREAGLVVIGWPKWFFLNL